MRIHDSPIPVPAGSTSSPQAGRRERSVGEKVGTCVGKLKQEQDLKPVYRKRGQDMPIRLGKNELRMQSLGHKDKCCFVICKGCPMSQAPSAYQQRQRKRARGPSQPNFSSPCLQKQREERRVSMIIVLVIGCPSSRSLTQRREDKGGPVSPGIEHGYIVFPSHKKQCI